MKEFLSAKLQTYSVETATLLLRQLITDTFLECVAETNFLNQQYFEKKVYVGLSS